MLRNPVSLGFCVNLRSLKKHDQRKTEKSGQSPSKCGQAESQKVPHDPSKKGMLTYVDNLMKVKTNAQLRVI